MAYKVPASVAATIVDAKGDLIVGTASDTVGRLAVGSNGQAKVADSSTASGHAYLYPRPVSLVQPSIGGVGDNSTSNNAAWTAALAAIANHGEIYVPPGIYRYTGLTIPTTGLVKIKGAGRGKTILRNTHASNPSIAVHGNPVGGEVNWAPGVGISDFTIDATAVNANQRGLSVDFAHSFDFNNIDIAGHGVGIRHALGWAGRYCNVYVLNCTKGFLGADPSTPLTLDNMNIYACGTGMELAASAVGWKVLGGTIASSTGVGLLIGVVGEQSISFDGMVFEGNAGDDVQLGGVAGGPQSIQFNNCHFLAHANKARSIFYQYHGPASFIDCRWRNSAGTLTTAIEQAATGANLIVRGASYENVTNYLKKWETAPYTVASIVHPSFVGWTQNGFESHSQEHGIRRKSTLGVLVSSAAETLTVGRPAYIYTGTGGTWNLPPIPTNANEPLPIKNRGSGTLTLQSNSGSQIYNTAAQASITVAAGASVNLVNDSTYWAVL
jgi:hypothetical protein